MGEHDEDRGTFFGASEPARPRERSPQPAQVAKSRIFDGNLSGYLIVGFLALVVGFFSGRWYLAHEIASAMSSAAEGFQRSVETAFGQKSSSTPPAAEKKPKPTPVEDKPAFKVTVLSKGYRDSDVSGSNYIHAAVTLQVSFENLTGKDVRAFEGTIRFTDLLDNPIASLGMPVNHAISAGGTYVWDAEMEYNQFMERDRALRNADLQNMKVSFVTTKILYEDGTVENR